MGVNDRRADQIVYDDEGRITGEPSDPRYVVPGEAPTTTSFHELVLATKPTNYYPLDSIDLATMVNGRGYARDLGMLGGVPRLAGYGNPSRLVMYEDNVANAVQYNVDLAGLKPGGLRVGKSHVPSSSIIPNPTSIEFSNISGGIGHMEGPISQSIVGTNSSIMFFFRANSFDARKHAHDGYTVGQYPQRPRIIGQYYDSTTTPQVAFFLNAVGQMEVVWGANYLICEDRLELGKLYQVILSSSPYTTALFINGNLAAITASTYFGRGGIGGTGKLQVGGYWTDNFGERTFQGEISNIAIWNYALDLYKNSSRGYLGVHADLFRRPALMMGSVTGRRLAMPIRKDRTIPMRTAVRTGAARPVIKTDGPAPPSDRFGMPLAERLRLLTSSIQDMKLALVTNIGGESTPGTEVSGGAYVRQPVLFTLNPTTGVATSVGTLRFDDIPACTILGWELWSGTQRRWYGYWSMVTGDQLGTLITAVDHGLSDGDKIVFATDSTPEGGTANQPYYVRDSTASTFKVSATNGGTVVALTDGGTVRFGRALEVPVPDSVEVEAGHLKLTLG